MVNTQDTGTVKIRKTICFTKDNRERIEAKWRAEKKKVEQSEAKGVTVTLNKLLNDLLELALNVEAESEAI